MNLRYDCLPGEWQDPDPIIDEPWPDDDAIVGRVLDFTARRVRRSYDIRPCPRCGRYGDYGEFDTIAGPRTRIRVTHRLLALPSGSFEILDACDVTALIAGNAAQEKAPRTAELAGVTVRGA
jgi:hypothetical protein